MRFPRVSLVQLRYTNRFAAGNPKEETGAGPGTLIKTCSTTAEFYRILPHSLKSCRLKSCQRSLESRRLQANPLLFMAVKVVGSRDLIRHLDLRASGRLR